MSPWLYVIFLTFVAVMLTLDLGVFHRQNKEIKVKEALLWTLFWISLAILFVPVVYLLYRNGWFGVGEHVDAITGKALTAGEACKVFIAGYLVEESLSLDNVFVIAVVLSFFRIPGKYQYRVLFWGILGAVVLRGLMIWLGSELVERFEWMNYVFGTILLYTAYKMLRTGDEAIELEHNPVVKITKKIFPVTHELHEEKFFIRQAGKLMATPLFLVLIVVDVLDVIFAVDSIPAIFSITSDPFLVFTSNIFAILGLRSLYFALAALMDLFHHLKASLVFLLAFLGVKMLIAQYVHISIEISLIIIVGALALGVVASLVFKDKKGAHTPAEERVEHAFEEAAEEGEEEAEARKNTV